MPKLENEIRLQLRELTGWRHSLFGYRKKEIQRIKYDLFLARLNS